MGGMVMTAKDTERFLSKLRITRDDDCWISTAGKQPGRRGRYVGTFKYEQRDRLAHRVAYELQYGPIPDGLSVLHHCDVPLCCNPAHLFLGTQADNMADMARKGRSSDQRGEANTNRKLTAAQVAEIL